MPVKCLIHHPGHGQYLRLSPLNDRTGYRFAACGISDGKVKIDHGELRDQGKNLVCSSKKTVITSSFWVMSFLIPRSYALNPANRYRLAIFDDKNVVVASSRNIRIEQDSRGIVITYPATNETVCPTFAAYGSSDLAGDMTVTLTSGSSTIATGTQVEAPPGWVYQVATGLASETTGLTLNASQPSGSAQSTGLTVLGCEDQTLP